MQRVFAAVAVTGFREHGTLGNASDPLRLKEKVGGAHKLALGVHGTPERGAKSFAFVTGGTFLYKAPANVFGFFLTTWCVWNLYVNLVSGFLLTHSCPFNPER